MNVLLIAPRAPQADGKGDAVRAAALLAALERSHRVRIFVPAPSPTRRVGSALADLLTGRPAQVGFSMPRASWTAARRAAVGADVVLAVTVRAVRGPLGTPLIIDHVDALSLNWALRSRGPENRGRRLVAGLEARRLRRWEIRVAGWAAAQLVVGEHEIAGLPAHPPVLVVPHVVSLPDPSSAPRDIDLVLTGNMGYPPNRQAALWLDRAIVPALRRLRPASRVVVAGRAADRLALGQVEIMSDVPSIPAILARSRVAIVPLVGLGTGTPTKALEAAACGAALVVTPWTHQRLPLPARVAADTSGLAAAVAALLDDEPARARLADQARAQLAGHGVQEIAGRLDALLEAVR